VEVGAVLTSSGMIRTPPKITAVDPNIVLHMVTSLLVVDH
jgi:hypothetical protein